MPTKNVSLSEKQAAFIRQSVSDGDYRNASEVVRTALRLLAQRAKEDKLRLQSLRRMTREALHEIDQGQFELVDVANVDQFIGRDRRARPRFAKRVTLQKSVSSQHLRFSPSALRDIEQVLNYTLANFGEQKYVQYRDLIREAILEIGNNPSRAPAKRREDVYHDAWTFHIARPGRRTRHLFVYCHPRGEFIDIVRLLHDSMDLRRHMPDDIGSLDQ